MGAIKPIKDEVRDLVRECVIRELVRRIAQQKQAPTGMNPTGPSLEDPGFLKLVPVFRSIENVKMRFAIADQLRFFQLLGDDAEIEFASTAAREATKLRT